MTSRGGVKDIMRPPGTVEGAIVVRPPRMIEGVMEKVPGMVGGAMEVRVTPHTGAWRNGTRGATTERVRNTEAEEGEEGAGSTDIHQTPHTTSSNSTSSRAEERRATVAGRRGMVLVRTTDLVAGSGRSHQLLPGTGKVRSLCVRGLM